MGRRRERQTEVEECVENLKGKCRELKEKCREVNSC